MNTATTASARASEFRQVLDYRAPFLIDKLLKEQIVDSADEGETLFAEVKKFLILDLVDPAKRWTIQSYRVDEVWHQFVLFTKEYGEFCNTYFGKYLHHAPGNSPKSPNEDSVQATSLEEFRVCYERTFGEPLAPVWRDEQSVKVSRRVLNDDAGTMMVAIDGDMVSLVGLGGHVFLSVTALARDALDFIARTGAFYVRELPGLSDEERVALVATLVEINVLRVAS